jgi:hypothetical protein
MKRTLYFLHLIFVFECDMELNIHVFWCHKMAPNYMLYMMTNVYIVYTTIIDFDH